MQLVAIDYKAPNAAELFTKSLRETGFGVLKNHPLQESWVSSIYQNWQTFFDGDKKMTSLSMLMDKMVSFQPLFQKQRKGFQLKISKSTSTITLGDSALVN